jgi:N-acetylmuramoyl-L-alanine amidase
MRRHLSPKRLRERLVDAAVQDNANVIANRLPPPLRPSRRLLHRWGRSAWLLGLSIGLVIGPAFVTQQSPWLQTPPPATMADEGVGAGPGPRAEASARSRRLDARVLALGVQRVVLDPGHGGIDAGASSASGLLEKDLTLDLARRTRLLLVEGGAEVVLTRAGDDTLSLKERAAAANGARGDIFVSLHLNVLEPASARGVETFYLGPSDEPEHDAIASVENQHSGYSLADMRVLLERIYADARRDESMRLARAVQRRLVRRLQQVDPGFVDRGVKTAPFIVLGATEMPAVLLEVSCLSNAEEAARLATEAHRQAIAEAVASGILAFMDHKLTHRRERKDARES